jgi:hypothetical protein
MVAIFEPSPNSQELMENPDWEREIAAEREAGIFIDYGKSLDDKLVEEMVK